MKKIYCDVCGKELHWDSSFEHWQKLVVTDMYMTSIPSKPETFDVCKSCWNRIKRENFEKKRAEHEHPLCQRCGEEIFEKPIGHIFGKTYCQPCIDTVTKEKHKPDKDARYTMYR
jgi:formylmethanofuran dehydrogenase subunit E